MYDSCMIYVFKTTHIQINFIEMSMEYIVLAHSPHQNAAGLSVLLVNPFQPSLSRYLDIGILEGGSHGITRMYPKRAHRLPFCIWSPPNSSTTKWWAQATCALSHQFLSNYAIVNVFHFLSNLQESTTQLCIVIFLHIFFFSASGRTDCKHDMVCVPSFLLAAAVLFGWEMF